MNWSFYALLFASFLIAAIVVYTYFRNHSFHSKQREFYENGNIKREYFILNKMKDGQETIFYPTGEINKTMNWQAGILNGPFTVFFKNGKKYISGFNENGFYAGTYIVYDIDGQIIMQKEY